MRRDNRTWQRQRKSPRARNALDTPVDLFALLQHCAYMHACVGHTSGELPEGEKAKRGGRKCSILSQSFDDVIHTTRLKLPDYLSVSLARPSLSCLLLRSPFMDAAIWERHGLSFLSRSGDLSRWRGTRRCENLGNDADDLGCHVRGYILESVNWVRCADTCEHR